MKNKLLLCALILLIAVSGCSSGKENSKSTKNPKYYPLTGLEVEGDATNRPVGVMINNQVEARPQTGLSQADIVFEILTEGNITRFLAVFQSEEPDVVGPVRSAREYFFELAKGYDALYVYHGSAKKVEKKLQASGVDSINGSFHDDDGKLFKREDFRVAPHNSYLLFGEVSDFAKSEGYEIESKQEPLTFLKKNAEIEGEQAHKVSISYSASDNPLVEFVYEDAKEGYSRYNDKEQTVELSNNKPIQVENVFVIEAPHEIIDEEGRRSVDMKSGGKGLLFQKGKMQTVEWKNDNGRIIPLKEGAEIGFVPGQTWINVIPTSFGLDQTVEISND